MSTRAVRVALLPSFALSVVACCSWSQRVAPPLESPVPGTADPRPVAVGDLPLCASLEDVERLHGERARIEGRYEVMPVAASKRLQAASVVLPDRTRVVESYRPVPARFCFVDRRVRVVGTVWRDANQPPDAQQLMGPHLRIEHIELAPGEAPCTEVPATLPAPPLVTTAAEIAAREDRYVLVFGTLEALVSDEAEGFWARATLRLADGTPVQIRGVPRARWASHEGRQVTVVGLVIVQGSGKAVTLHLESGLAICPGRAERCGMPPDRGVAPGEER